MIVSLRRIWEKQALRVKAGGDGGAILRKCLLMGYLDPRPKQMKKVLEALRRRELELPVKLLRAVADRYPEEQPISKELAKLSRIAGDLVGAAMMSGRASRAQPGDRKLLEAWGKVLLEAFEGGDDRLEEEREAFQDTVSSLMDTDPAVGLEVVPSLRILPKLGEALPRLGERLRKMEVGPENLKRCQGTWNQLVEVVYPGCGYGRSGPLVYLDLNGYQEQFEAWRKGAVEKWGRVGEMGELLTGQRGDDGEVRWEQPEKVSKVLIVVERRSGTTFLPPLVDTLEGTGCEVRVFVLDCVDQSYRMRVLFERSLGRQVSGEGQERNLTTLGGLVDWADCLVVEWFNEAVSFVTSLAQTRVPVVVRLHACEAARPMFWHGLDWGRIKGIVFVSEHIRRLFCAQLPEELAAGLETAVIPNSKDAGAFAREKLEGAEFTLGMLKYEYVKDPVYALELFKALSAKDGRYRMVIAGPHPDTLLAPAVPPEPGYTERTEALMEELQAAGKLRVEGVQDDPAEWFRQVGWVLSTSFGEGTHEAAVEGVCSGAVAVVRRWPHYREFGAAEAQFPCALYHETPEEGAGKILELAGSGGWGELGRKGQEAMVARLEDEGLRAKWKGLLCGGGVTGDG